MTEVRLQTLGRFALQVSGTDVAPPSTQKATALLVFLIMHAEREIVRESLLELFWPSVDPERARASLKTATWSIRRNFRAAGFEPDELLVASKVSMRWIAHTTVDAREFASRARATDAAVRMQALPLYAGDFLDGNYEDWVIEERERLAATYEATLREAVERTSDPSLAQRLLARNPYDEQAWSVLIDGEVKAGRPITARILVNRCREALREVGAVPSNAFEERFGNIVEDAAQQSSFALPFIGRERELSTLLQSWRAVREGRGSIMLVDGEAGIGKSALVDQAQRVSGVQAINVHAVVNDPRTFGIWAELFERLCSLPFVEFAKASGSDVVAAVARELCARLPRHSVVVIEDAHAIEDEAFAVLTAFLPLAASQGHAVVLTTRPEGLPRLQAALSSTAVGHISLSTLSRDDVQATLLRSLETSGDGLAAWLYERSAGHPYFLTSLVRALVDEGIIERHAARWKATAVATASLPLPRDLRRFIESRLRARGETAAAVACALALDPEASTSDLIASLGADESAVMDAIDDLLALGLIQQPATGPEFAFNHHLTAEVANTLLSSARRVQVHAGFARCLADTKFPESSVRRARHLEAAAQPLEAAEAYLTGASMALEVFAWRDALSRARAGINVLDRLDGTPAASDLLVRLLLIVAHAEAAGGNDRAALPPLDRAISLAREGSDRELLADALYLKAKTLLNVHEIDAAIAAATDGSQHAAASGKLQLVAQQSTLLCSAYAHVPDKAKALAFGDEALTTAQRSEAFDVVAASADALLRAQVMWWQFSDAERTAAIGLEAARRANWVAEGAMHLTLGMVWYYVGDYARAIDELEQTRAVAVDERGERRWLVSVPGVDRLKLRFFARYVLGMIAAAQRRWDDAVAVAQELADAELFRAHYMVRNNVLHLWTDALLQRNGTGDIEKAGDLVTMLHDDAYEQGSVLDFSACVALTRARVAAARGSADAPILVHGAYRRVAALAALRPLECDRAFAHVALAADAIRDTALGRKARADAAEFRREREAAAIGWRAQIAVLQT